MSHAISRRAWLRSSGLLAAGALLSPAAQALAPAAALLGRPAAPTLIKLSGNENPWGPSDKARQAMRAAFDDCNRYPNDYLKALRAQIAAAEGLTPEHVLLGAGSTEILSLAGLAYGAGGGQLVSAWPAFPLLMQYGAEHAKADWVKVPLDANLAHDLPAMARAVTPATRLVYVCNPNNPTGTVLPAAPLRDFCQRMARQTTVLVDEAYLEYLDDPAANSMADLVRTGQNVIVLRTFSKIYGLAGLRLGYALAAPAVVQRLSRLAMGWAWGQGVPALAAAQASLADQEFVRSSRRHTRAGREALQSWLTQHSIRHAPAAANFVFVSLEQFPASFPDDLLQRNLQVGRVQEVNGGKWSRISIGTPEQMKQLTAAMAGLRQA
ncbi:pyridoxal phosphate-dependent aminotransferase [Hymenobacter sp. B81]|uniref:pyridoxal phosphate-dependent aminotransferase n=1 Tax=Hymenobacter sp. B81 TaxID=3344878 RepID=UPI0037DC4411